ncbi:AtzH-like domain-containing protein [Frigoribacterium sp. UYMn621]|uniref:AtzH-like domain-containing protein n=1 Tax=Frigoribacterium sp. UYMn621 TaxID=3156343 RepID=UPI0033956957
MTDSTVEGDAPDGLLDAFWEYERALMANDLGALDRLFAPGDGTLRSDAGGVLVGHDAISAFRQGRGGAPARSIGDIHVRDLGNDRALVVAVTLPATGGRGQQTQLWHRSSTNDGDVDWLVEAAHVSVPAPAIAASVWRVVGSPLVTGATEGPLVGETVAVKDLFDVAGFAVGAGVPAYLAEAPRTVAHASAVTALLAAGATVQGIAQTDEFAYSVAGKNSHYGTPPNAAVAGAIPGGSSSGAATAVASGQVSIGLGTDTGGSIRVPASYQGLWGLRTTHDAVARAGLLGLAPSFDTVGWMTRDAATLRAAASASLGSAGRAEVSGRFAVAPALLALASPELQDAFAATLARLAEAGLTDDLVEVTLPDIDDLHEIFRTVQSAEAWATHGEWITAHPDALGSEIAGRFAFGATIDPETESFARQALELARERIESIVGERVLLLPSASSVAPSTTADAETIEQVRQSTLRLTCVAGIAGRPALSVPLLTVEGAPVGFGLVGPPNTDVALIALGESLA